MCNRQTCASDKLKSPTSANGQNHRQKSARIKLLGFRGAKTIAKGGGWWRGVAAPKMSRVMLGRPLGAEARLVSREVRRLRGTNLQMRALALQGIFIVSVTHCTWCLTLTRKAPFAPGPRSQTLQSSKCFIDSAKPPPLPKRRIQGASRGLAELVAVNPVCAALWRESRIPYWSSPFCSPIVVP